MSSKDRDLEEALREVSLVNAHNAEHASTIKDLNEQISDAHMVINQVESMENHLKKESHGEGFLQGIEACRQKILLTFFRHKFIRSWWKGLWTLIGGVHNI